jgi:23S rRNA pseudouridine1911/1915/1917 synthase
LFFVNKNLCTRNPHNHSQTKIIPNQHACAIYAKKIVPLQKYNKNTMNLQVLYEDNHLIAINKPAGLAVQQDESNEMPLIEYVKEYIKHKYNKEGAVFLEAVHRIDKPVTGVILFARTTKALQRMNVLFKDREVTKIYRAVVRERPELEKNTLVHYLKKDREKNKSRAYDTEVNESKRAELTYEMISYHSNHALLEIRPTTGRPHQIRVQLAMIGCPIKGDLKYGYPTPNFDRSISLHAYSLSFIHPVTKLRLTIKVPPPRTNEWIT